jgi:lipopolysaccharide transport system ATP-binding protein
MSSDELAISVQNLSKCYQIYDRPQDRLKQSIVPRIKRLFGRTCNSYYREFWALQDISFEVRKGENVGIIGLNGSGKSTLLQIICGTLAATSGRVEARGRISGLLELGSGFNPDFTGRENVYLNGSVLGLSDEEINARYDDIQSFADIGDFINQPVKTYSSGMVVRLAFAVSVCVDPEILILDEALAVGDAAFQFKCIDRLQNLVKSGTTLLFVSHDTGIVKNFCTKALYLKDGRIKDQGAPAKVAEQYFMDLRDKQRGSIDRRRVFSKETFVEGVGHAFGTDEGRIVSAFFTNTGKYFSSFLHGEEVSIDVEVEYSDSIKYPHLSVLLQDRRHVELGGNFFVIGNNRNKNNSSIKMRFCFIANLSAGRYYITLRLEDRVSAKSFLPIEKLSGAMSMEILATNKMFLGAVDFGIKRIS